MSEIKLDPEVVAKFKPEMINTEEGERAMSCFLLEKDPKHLTDAFSSVYACMAPEKEMFATYEAHQSKCMTEKARAEEAAYDKEQAEKAKKP